MWAIITIIAVIIILTKLCKVVKWLGNLYDCDKD